MSFSEQEIRNRVSAFIEAEENLGDQAGGSGHLSHVSYQIDTIDWELDHDREDQKGQYARVQFVYTISVVTEFTYEPDNPPYTEQYKQCILLDRDYRLVSQEKKKAVGGSPDLII